MRQTLIAILLLASQISIGQSRKDKFDFTIIFGSCFNSDSVSLKLNGKEVFRNIKLKSNVVGSANFSVTQYKRNLKIELFQKATIMPRVTTTPKLEIEISINSQTKTYIYDLKKGKIIYVKYCWDETPQHNRTITVQQQDYPVMFI